MGLFSRARQLEALQVEVTSRCTRHCSLCPRSALADAWTDGDMGISTWQRIEPALSLATHVHLQGWGEPLLHPSLREMVRSAKRAGAKVGITTNGDLLEPAVDWILDERLDLVTLSVGADARARQENVSACERTLTAAAVLAGRTRTWRGHTKAQISYLLTRDNASDLPIIVEAAARARVHELFVIHLDTTPDDDRYNLRAFDQDGLQPGVAAHLDAAEAAARRHRLRFRGPARRPEDVVVCALDPVRFVFVAWDGRVGPCVNLLLPVRGPIRRWGAEGGHAVDPVCYGHLNALPLAAILTGEARSRFTAPFRTRLQAEQRFRGALLSDPGADASRRLIQLDEERNAVLDSAPFPDACAGCHKRSGW